MALSARAEPDLRVRGEVVAVAPRLEVRVLVQNTGAEDARPLSVVGELFGQRREARVSHGVAPGGEAAVILDFDATRAQPGLHALALLLEHPVEGPPDPGGRPPVASHRAVVLVSLGPRPPAAVTLDVECPEDGEGCTTSIDVQGSLIARLESADGEPHPVRLRVLTARGLRPSRGSVEADVPATGVIDVPVPIVRAGAPRGSRHGVLLVAETTATPVKTAVAETTVRIQEERALVPRLRWMILGLGLALLVAAALAEWRHGRRPSDPLSPADPTPTADPGP